MKSLYYLLVRSFFWLWRRRPMFGSKVIELKDEMYESLRLLNAPCDILSAVGSLRDTLDDETAFWCIKEWNRRRGSSGDVPNNTDYFILPKGELIRPGDQMNPLMAIPEIMQGNRWVILREGSAFVGCEVGVNNILVGGFRRACCTHSFKKP